MEDKVCVFCMAELGFMVFVCNNCQDYKGVMFASEAKEYLK